MYRLTQFIRRNGRAATGDEVLDTLPLDILGKGIHVVRHRLKLNDALEGKIKAIHVHIAHVLINVIGLLAVGGEIGEHAPHLSPSHLRV